MGRDARRGAAELVDDSTILELFVNVGRLARNREFRKTRAAAARAPRRNGYREIGKPPLYGVDFDAAPRELPAKRFIVFLERFDERRVGLGDELFRQGHCIGHKDYFFAWGLRRPCMESQAVNSSIRSALVELLRPRPNPWPPLW